MEVFFSQIYGWFCNTGKSVYKIMRSLVDDNGDQLLDGMFTTIGVTTVVISLVVAVAFYLWPINHPRFKAWWSWLIMLGCNALINFGLGFAFLKYRIGVINDNRQDELDVLGDWSPSPINEDGLLSLPFSQWLDFACANAFVSVLFFMVASLILMWLPGNCRFSPFRN